MPTIAVQETVAAYVPFKKFLPLNLSYVCQAPAGTGRSLGHKKQRCCLCRAQDTYLYLVPLDPHFALRTASPRRPRGSPSSGSCYRMVFNNSFNKSKRRARHVNSTGTRSCDRWGGKSLYLYAIGPNIINEGVRTHRIVGAPYMLIRLVLGHVTDGGIKVCTSII